jgi:citrate synthase
VAKNGKRLRSEIAWSTPERIGVMGYDLVDDLIGKIDFGDMTFLMLAARLPDPRESRMFNAMLVTSVEHGMVPSAIATRMTLAGAPESLQGAVAAGLLGLGTVFNGTTEGAAKMLIEALPDRQAKADLPALADRIVAESRSAKRAIPGIGHPIHKPHDPRALKLFALAEETGFSGRYVQLMKLIQQKAEQASGKVLPMNSTGAKAAISCEMGLPAEIARGLGVISRAVGLVGHVLEESRNPMALEIWHRVDEEASEDSRGQLRTDRGPRHE